MNRIKQWCCIAALLGVSVPVWAANNIEWHGFVAQGLIRAQDSGFVNASGELSAELTELGLNSRYSLTPSLHIAGQLVYLDGGNRYPSGLRLDYLLLDWYFYNSPDWQANAYLGRFKNQHWLYSSTRDVPFTRPTIVLPQSVYFDAFRDIAVSSDGVALQARHNNALGDFTFNWGIGTSPVSAAQGKLVLGSDIAGDLKLDFDHQASMVWQPDLSHFSYGIVLLDSNFSYHALTSEHYFPADFGVRRIMLSVRYQLERWEFSSELQQERIDISGFFSPLFQQGSIGQGGYVLAQFRQTPRLKWFAMLDYSVANKDDRRGKKLSASSGGVVPAYFGYQQSVAVGASFDLHDSLRISAEAHFVEGTGRLSPVILPDLVANQHKYWQLYAVQLMYRF
ncbi:hypothetical protein [Rheinheimera maricola]|uniref:Alginate export domain-containing protein n=1 Tax=Rheinheimera maricola TaxID=2793282 RepID=A0ABS7XCV7_9GAMM|nr:hypothetical protein [Rheinheimera maricola]MBZ9613389.1 hypothetical protein [Rheinheimera maricola]